MAWRPVAKQQQPQDQKQQIQDPQAEQQQMSTQIQKQDKIIETLLEDREQCEKP